MAAKHDLIAVLDFGAQYAMLIARRVRECNVYCEVFPYDVPAATLKAKGVKGIIFSGGPASVYEADSPQVDQTIYRLGVPILGICYGIQLIAKDLGGKVEPGSKREYGKAELFIDDNTGILKGLGDVVWMSHGDKIDEMPEGFVAIGHTPNSPVAAMGNVRKGFYGLQFHPESILTKAGKDILRNFLKIKKPN